MLFNHGAHVQVDTRRCLNQQHNGVECNHCVSHCPGQALILSDHQIYLIQDQCLGCGLCFSDCPTQVFSSTQWDETTISSDMEEQGAKSTQIFCGYHPAPYLSKEEKDKGAVQVHTCLSAISKGMWYELGLLTGVELRLDECQNCPMKDCLERMKFAVETAMEWLSASGHTPDFSLIYTAEKAKKKKKLQAVSSGLKVTSRRDLFLTLMGRKPGSELMAKEKKAPPGSDERAKKARINVLPDWQKRLEDSYSSHFQEGGSPAYWPSIQMSTECVNCGMCARYCPTQALKIRVEVKECIHDFTSGHCLDCRICMLSCPTRSILRDRQPNAQPYKEQSIFKAPVGKCRICEAETITSQDDLCYWCKEEPSEEDILSDVRKKLFGKLV
ncbi:MAG TPA: 4Fe-4S binding protein [Desulfitobacterium dehalogenans]|uniref:4Fe-4S binding protein n=1 Tax=Desulfitobacterium dehalogenans TaxID=36854 RepID=A0A7C7D455_9FIRM|nr:4Fe-4S binding protein [Desulfitobacterium dehalogenans]